MNRHGIILAEEGLTSEAIAAFVKSIEVNPKFWGAWLELAKVVESGEKVCVDVYYASVDIQCSSL